MGSPPVAPPPAAPPTAENPLDVSGTWADPAGDKKLEHVNDFFAPDTLGFANDGSHIETAGPGRLTILGFVPKSTGSIKTTILALVAMFLIAGGWVGYMVWQADITKKKNKLFGEVRESCQEIARVRLVVMLRDHRREDLRSPAQRRQQPRLGLGEELRDGGARAGEKRQRHELAQHVVSF